MEGRCLQIFLIRVHGKIFSDKVFCDSHSYLLGPLCYGSDQFFNGYCKRGTYNLFKMWMKLKYDKNMITKCNELPGITASLILFGDAALDLHMRSH